MQLSVCLQNLFCLSMVAVAMVLMWQLAYSTHILARIREYRATHQHNPPEYTQAVSLPVGVHLLRDISYGNDVRQHMDIYLPEQAVAAPVILMVHGGGWRRGDKALQAEVQNKMMRWVPKGFIFISVNYRLLPKAQPLAQCEDIRLALTAAQAQATSWGGDPDKFILMGHSSGAHLISLLNAAPDKAWQLGARPWLGAVSLDSCEFDIVKLMDTRHNFLHDDAFGDDPAEWRAASPFYALNESAPPFLLVCSTQNSNAYAQAIRFTSRADSKHVRTRILQQDLSHSEINQLLGLEGAYTEAVEEFMGSLDESVKQRFV